MRDDLMGDLALFLETLPAHALAMRRWVDTDDPEDRPHPDPQCGTAACAIGWGCTLPSWQAAGFRLARAPFLSSGPYGYALLPEWRAEPGGRGLYGWPAVQAGLGIPFAAAIGLFTSAGYAQPPGPLDVAAKLRRYIEGAAADA